MLSLIIEVVPHIAAEKLVFSNGTKYEPLFHIHTDVSLDVRVN